MNKAGKHQVITKCILAMLILFQVFCVMTITLNLRPGGDEWFTYGLSNNTDGHIFMNEKWINEKTEGTGWVSTEYFKDYLLVNEGEEFDFASVLYNQKKDVHPPLYYMLVHFLCSFSAEEVLMIQGGIINAIFLVAINIILWIMGKEFFESDYERLLPAFALCLSTSVAELYTYDRMYSMLAFFCLCITCLQLKLRKNMNSRRILILIGLITCLGCLTHYYFYMYLFAAFVMFAFERLILSKEKIKVMFPCVAAHCAGGLTAILLYPTAIKHVLFSYRGEQIRDGLFGSKLEGFTEYYKILDSFCAGGHLGAFLLIVILLILTGFFVKKLHVGTDRKDIFLLLGTILFFYLIMAFISYEKVWAYVSPIYVPIAFALGLLVVKALWFIPKNFRALVGAIGIFLMLGNSLYANVENAIDSNEYNMEIDAMLATQQGRDCIFVYESWNNLYDNRILDLMNFDEVLSVSMEEIMDTDIASAMQMRESEDEMVVYLYDKDNEELEAQIAYIEQAMGKEATLLFSSRKYSVFSMN